MKVYCITEWVERYEVGSDGRACIDEKKFRAGPLKYLRLPVFGNKQGMGLRRLRDKAGSDRFMSVFGVFVKCLELAADLPRGKRGYILNHKGKAADSGDIAEILGVSEDEVRFALDVLSDESVDWMRSVALQETEFSAEFSRTAQVSQNSAESSGIGQESAKYSYNHTIPYHNKQRERKAIGISLGNGVTEAFKEQELSLSRILEFFKKKNPNCAGFCEKNRREIFGGMLKTFREKDIRKVIEDMSNGTGSRTPVFIRDYALVNCKSIAELRKIEETKRKHREAMK